MKRLRIFLFGMILLTVLLVVWMVKTKPGEILATRTFVSVDAPADKVWATLADASSYPAWNPYVLEVSSQLKAGEKVEIVEQIDGKRDSHIVRVTSFDPAQRKLEWHGSTIPAALMKWTESFEVEVIDANHSRLAMTQSHEGLVAQLYWKYNKNKDLQAYREFSVALKKKAEER